MKIMETKELYEKYEVICNEFVKKFEEKQQIHFDGWGLFCIFVYGKNNRNL